MKTSQKMSSTQAGLQIQNKTKEGYEQEVCHSVGNQIVEIPTGMTKKL